MRPALPDPRKVWRSGKAAAFAGPRTWKYCFKLDLAMILACACDKWGVFAEMWVTSNRQDRNIFVGRVKGMLLENFHRSWLRSHQRLFSSWNKCDSQQRDDGLNWEVCVAAVCTKGIYLYGERAEMVVFLKEASAVRKATPNPSCTMSGNLKSSLSNSQIPSFHPQKTLAGRRLKMDGCLYTTPTPDTIGYLPSKVQMCQGEMFNKTLPM